MVKVLLKDGWFEIKHQGVLRQGGLRPPFNPPAFNSAFNPPAFNPPAFNPPAFNPPAFNPPASDSKQSLQNDSKQQNKEQENEKQENEKKSNKKQGGERGDAVSPNPLIEYGVNWEPKVTRRVVLSDKFSESSKIPEMMEIQQAVLLEKWKNFLCLKIGKCAKMSLLLPLIYANSLSFDKNQACELKELKEIKELNSRDRYKYLRTSVRDAWLEFSKTRPLTIIFDNLFPPIQPTIVIHPVVEKQVDLPKKNRRRNR